MKILYFFRSKKTIKTFIFRMFEKIRFNYYSFSIYILIEFCANKFVFIFWIKIKKMEGENVSLMENRRAKELSERDELIEKLIKERYQTRK